MSKWGNDISVHFEAANHMHCGSYCALCCIPDIQHLSHAKVKQGASPVTPGHCAASVLA